MGRLFLSLASGVAIAGLAAPASAQTWGSPHRDEHEQLDDQHDDVHGDLNDVHEEAHEEGLNRWEHRDLHRDLNRAHRIEDRQIRREHGGWHNGYNGSRRYYRYYRGYNYRNPNYNSRSSSIYFNFGR